MDNMRYMIYNLRGDIMNKKITAMPIREQLYEAVKDSILRNAFIPGSLLQIDRLAEEYGVSATPVREALVRLESDGLVTLIPNKGAQVTEITEEDIREIWEMRRLLEPYAARSSAPAIREEDIAELERLILKLREDPSDTELYIKTDIMLHNMLYFQCPNSYLRETLRKVHEVSYRIRYFAESRKTMHDAVIHEVIREHLDILDILRSRDPDRIVVAVSSHLLNGERRALSALARNKS